MTITYISTNTIGAGPLFTYAAAGDTLSIFAGVTLASTSSSALGGTGLANINLTILGTLATASRPSFTGGGANIVIGVGGTYVTYESVSGNAGLFLNSQGNRLLNNGSFSAETASGILSTGGNEIVNNGVISGASAVSLGQSGGSDDIFINSGTVIANTYDDGTGIRFNNAVRVEGIDTRVVNAATGVISATSSHGAGVLANEQAGGSSIENHGLITSARAWGVDLGNVSAGQAAVHVLNFGTISGGTGALIGSINADVLVNRGLMAGDVLMGTGNDTLDARDGRIEGNVDLGAGDDSYDGRGAFIAGTVFGGDGADTFIGNAGLAETFDGGSDSARDTLDFRTLGAAVVALDALFDTDGSAAGDTYIGFENIYGSARGADVLRGSSAANTLLGFGGNDAIDGAAGNDILRGDGGIDTMTGGLGNDVFRFVSITDIGDAITDFHNVAGDNDRIEIRAAGFGGGLVAGALAASAFVSRADNLAQDADDRFIFRTTDRTLWFDDDGTGSHAAVMVADLQAGATFTAADILIV